VLGGGGELFAAGDLGVGIGFDVIGDAVGGEAKIDAGIAVEVERAVNALGRPLDRFDELRREILGGADVDIVALLILQIVLDLLGGDKAMELQNVAELAVLDRENQQALVAVDAAIKLADVKD